MLHQSQGILTYTIDHTGHKLFVKADQDLSNYYRSLVPKYFYIQPQAYPAHISVVRKEAPINIKFWGKHEGKIINFYYDSEIKQGEVYWWLNVFCKELEEIRFELGLPVDSIYTRPPDGFEKTFHMTIGNKKGV